MKNDNNLAISTTNYTKIMWRYKCSNDSIKAKIVVGDDAAYSQEVLADSNSTEWTAGSATLTAAKTLDHVNLYADHAVGTVYYDFILFYTDDWDFPANQPESMTFTPGVEYARIKAPSRIGAITQHMGSDSATVEMVCNLDVGDWTREGDYINGEVFHDISHNSKDEPWQWLDTEYEQFKVTMDPPRFVRRGDSHMVYLTFREYRHATASEENSVERYGLNL